MISFSINQYLLLIIQISKYVSLNKNSLEDDEKWILLMMALYIIKESSNDIMNAWWRIESVSNLKHYFSLLNLILTYFDVCYSFYLFYSKLNWK